MRLYSFVNYYLSGIQHGIQTAHCVGDMSRLYKVNTGEKAAYDEWADNHKTIIVCNGGNSLQLAELFEQLIPHAAALQLPLVKFHEDEQSLNGALTAVAIVLPSGIYEAQLCKGTTGPDMYYNDNLASPVQWIEGRDFEFDLVKLIKSYRLA